MATAPSWRGRTLARVAALLAAACLAAPGVQPAGAHERVLSGAARFAGVVPFGTGDQNPAMFSDPRLAWLGVRYARVLVPWDAPRHKSQMDRAAAWLAQAQAAGVQPLVAFDQSVTHSGHLPTVAAYAHQVRQFMHRFPWVTHYQTWDEENQGDEPTARDPARAADLFNWLNAACHHCSVTAADLLDGPSMYSWLRRFLRRAHHPTIWGFHPYLELTYGGHEALSDLARMVPGQIWLTEAGMPVWHYIRGLRQFRFSNPYTQRRAVRRLLALLRDSRRITRIYYYQWRSRIPAAVSLHQFHRHRHVAATWDSGLLNPDCSPRPAFEILARALGRNPARAPRTRTARHGLECVAAHPRAG